MSSFNPAGSPRDAALARAVHGLRAQMGSAAEVDALRGRLAAELGAPTASTGSAPAGTVLAGGAAAGLLHSLQPWLPALGVLGAATLAALMLWPDAVDSEGQHAPGAPAPSQAQPPAAIAAPEAATPPQPPAPPEQPRQANTAPEPQAPAAAPERKRPARRKAAPRPRAVVVDAEGELSLLQRAQSLLDAQPAATLELTREHQRAHPRGVFSEEREVLAIEALLKLRRRADAVQRAERFMQRYPKSTHAARVRGLVPPSP